MRRERILIYYCQLALDRIHFLGSTDRVRRDDPDWIEVEAFLRLLQTFFETLDQLPDEIKQEYPHIDWSGVDGFRNVVAHAYMEMSWPKIWSAIDNDLPAIETMVQELVEREKQLG